MATKYVCDRCGNETANSEDIFKVEIPRYNPHAYQDHDEDTFNKDLCAGCVMKLNEFVQPLLKVKSNE